MMVMMEVVMEMVMENGGDGACFGCWLGRPYSSRACDDGSDDEDGQDQKTTQHVTTTVAVFGYRCFVEIPALPVLLSVIQLL